MAEQSTAPVIINSLMLPLVSQALLLPQTVMAEIVPSQPVHALHQAPQWMRGLMPWRGINIPLVSFESMCERDTRVSLPQNFAVLHATEQSDMPFYALELRGIPQPVRVQEEELEQGRAKDKDCNVVAFNVMVNGSAAVMADLSVLENKVAYALQAAV